MSLYKIDWLIDKYIMDVYNDWNEDEETWDLIYQRLPSYYSSFKDVFSKVKLDKLPPH